MAIPTRYDVLIRNGMIFDGSGTKPYIGDVAINGDQIVMPGKIGGRGDLELDAKNLAVAPGFINMLSWANESLIEDGRSQSDIRQGVTLEVLGEGFSMGPLNDLMKVDAMDNQRDIRYEICWTTLAEYLNYLVKRGISTNIASFVGATTIRINVLGCDDRQPTKIELDQMCHLVDQAMREGALGLSSALAYVPGCFAQLQELIALARVVAGYGGIYISHIRNEGKQLLQAINELIEVARQAKIGAEIYHMKVSGEENWDKLDMLIERVEAALDEGLHITANMYPYTALSTGFELVMPPWVQEGGVDEWIERLKNPAIRERVKSEMIKRSDSWDNAYLASGSPENIILVGFRNPALKPLTGKTLSEISILRHTSPEDTAIDLVIEDHSGLDAVFKTMSEENVRKQIALSWVSFGSDSPSLAPEGIFLRSSIHPRAYGSFTRLLGKYSREHQIIPLEEAIMRLTLLPANNLKLDRRGRLASGYFADVVVFDPTTIQDCATFENPHQYSRGMLHVFVNGQQVLKEGEHTNTMPGRVVQRQKWAL